MGASCSSIDDNEPEIVEKGQTKGSHFSHLVKTTPLRQRFTGVPADSPNSKMSRASKRDPVEWTVVDALDDIINAKVKPDERVSTPSVTPEDGYMAQRDELRKREETLDFTHRFASTASSKEKDVDRILQAAKQKDREIVFSNASTREGFNGQRHSRFAGDHFLSNKDLIDKCRVFKIATKIPKGAHLHIHFNACLKPAVLLDIAKNMEHMYITSDLPLTDTNNFHNLKRAKIQFSIMANPENKGNLFESSYADRGAQKFKEFLKEYPEKLPGRTIDAMAWLQEKLVFSDKEAHNELQTVGGAWEEFNMRTQMMKGLFNYETAYRTYTRKCLEDFVADNIQYAEIRPNFMDTNQVWRDDGSSKIDNTGIMTMIIEEVQKFQKTNKAFGGLKVIYCCPRSFPQEKVAHGLRECLEFKKKWPNWIAGKLSLQHVFLQNSPIDKTLGFDLVGEESKPKPLKEFVPQFLEFQRNCKEAKVEIPFLFHCGETLETGSETDENLLDALLLKSKRIGHGFALARHPYIMECMKKQGICLEVCPISNEVLGLTPRVNGHAMYNLLANNVHCTVNSDNGTLFK